MHRRIAILSVVASTLLLMGLSAGQALAAGDDDIPGVPVGAGTINGVVDASTDPWDVYAVKLFDGEQMKMEIDQGYARALLYAPSTTTVISGSPPYLARCGYLGFLSYAPSVTYTPAKDGIYYIAVKAYGSGVSYALTLSGSVEQPPRRSYLRLRTSATKVTRGRSVTLSARLVNADSALIAGYSVNLFRSYNGRSWTKVKSLSSTTGQYSTRARIVRKTWFKMKFAGDATWSRCSSRAATVSVR